MRVESSLLADAAVKAKPVALSPAMNAGQAFQAIGANCLRHMRDNAPGVSKAHDIESLHQMRVGMRRLRSALAIFKNMLHLPEKTQHDLDWLATALGDARDWDVLAGTTLPAVAACLAEPGQLDAVRQAATARSLEHRLAAAAAVGSPRYAGLMRDMTKWLQAMGWRGDADRLPEQSAGRFARKILQRNQRRLRARARHLDTPEQRHRLRIAAKKARYGAEFFASLCAPKTVRRYVKRLTGLQDALGLLNDAAVADRLLAELASGQPHLEAGAQYARGYLAARADADSKQVVKRWKKFARVRLPR